MMDSVSSLVEAYWIRLIIVFLINSQIYILITFIYFVLNIP